MINDDLYEMISLLEGDGCEGWADFFRVALYYSEKEDYLSCAQKIKSGSGGMGSLNDLILGQKTDENGVFTWKDNYMELNERFNILLSNLYAYSDAVLRKIK
jgi:hypothetical protein